MFQDQAHIDITNVVVEKRTFQRRERIYAKVLAYFCAFYFIASFLIILALILVDSGVGDEDKSTYFARLVIITVTLAIDIVFLVTTFALFTYVAYTKHRAAFLDYRTKLVLQVIGTLATLAINTYQVYG